MKKALTLILLSSLLIMQSCLLYGKKDTLTLSSTIKQKTELDSTLTSVNVSNNLVTIQGSGFSNVTTVKMTGTSLNADLNIDSKSDSQIIASATSALSLLVGETFNLIIGTVDAQVTYTVTFTLQNGAIQLSHLSSLGATTAGQILKFNGTAWGLGTLSNSQTYLGAWNATTHLPDITTLGTFNAGDYYIVSTVGSYTSGVLAVSPTTFGVGDWVMFNGSSWEQITNSSLTGSGTANYIPYYSSSSVLANSPMSISGSNIGIGTATPGSSLDVKGTLRLSGTTSGFVGLAPAAVAGGTTYTLPAADGTNGQVLTTNASGVLSWTSISVSGGTVTGVTSANTDIGVASGTSAPVLTLNSGTSADQIVKLTAAAKLPAVDGSLLTNLTSTNLVGAVAVANGGTGATTLGASQSALGITLAGPLTGNVPALGATVIADRLCASDSSGGTISCINNLPAATVRGSVSGTSGTGNLLFATSPTISSPVITNIAPAADFTLTQNSVVPFTSVNTGAVANTLYLSAGNVGIGTTTPSGILSVNPPQYSTGTASQAGTTVTGTGTTFTAAMVGSQLVYANGVSSGTITAFTSTTSLTVTTSQAVTIQAFGIKYSGLNVTSTGNVGIGTSSPSSVLDVSSGGASGVRITTAASTVASPQIYLNDPNRAVTSVITSVSPGGTNGLYIGTSPGNTTFMLGTNAVERMRIDSSGNVGIGTTTPSAQLHVGKTAITGTMTSSGTAVTGTGTNFSSSLSVGDTIIVSGQTKVISAIASNTSLTTSVAFSPDVTNVSLSRVGAILNNGNVGIGTTGPSTILHVVGSSGATIATFADGGATTCTVTPATTGFACSSDQRLKKNIESVPDMDSLDKILKLRTVTYNWRNIDNGRHTGYIAQEIEKVAPEFVRTGDDGYKQVSYSGFIPWITGAIKAFYGEFKALAAGVMRLEGKSAQNVRLIASVKAESAEVKALSIESNDRSKKLEVENQKLKKENEEMKARLNKIEKLLEKLH